MNQGEMIIIRNLNLLNGGSGTSRQSLALARTAQDNQTKTKAQKEQLQDNTNSFDESSAGVDDVQDESDEFSKILKTKNVLLENNQQHSKQVTNIANDMNSPVDW
jgi:copper oxidase (laccase) domain-containing protein